jgi:cobyrinic acid a,c-diamide synthase
VPEAVIASNSEGSVHDLYSLAPLMSAGIIIAAPASGSGKTTVTLGILRALKAAGQMPVSVKVGPDYIDPGFHAAASSAVCMNLDSWAMQPETFDGLVRERECAGNIVIAEGVMGLFDGATLERGTTAEVAQRTGWPVVFVVDVSGMAGSVAPLVKGFAQFRAGVRICGVIANRTGSERHAALIADALGTIGIPLLGHLPRDQALSLPSRHLGLVMAGEQQALETFLDRAAAQIAAHVDLEALCALARPASVSGVGGDCALAPPGQRIALARDDAFAFAYPHLLAAWQRQGVEVTPFSPLANEAPADFADAVYLPGGYPELHAGSLASNQNFLQGTRRAAKRGASVFGECGGFMVLGQALQDADGIKHSMLGLLPVETSFANPRLSLGYRHATLQMDCALGCRGQVFTGHEFHFAQTLRADTKTPLFACSDARGEAKGLYGCARANVFGSFIHLIDRA